MPLLVNKICELSIPKTGGTWRRRILSTLGVEYKHIEPRHGILPAPEAEHTYTFIRHPVTWLPSRFSIGEHNDMFSALYRKHKNFHDFVDAYLEECPGQVGREMWQYIRNVDEVCKYEQLASEFIFLLKKMGVPYQPLPKKVISPTLNKPLYLPGQDRAVCDAEAEFIKEFY